MRSSVTSDWWRFADGLARSGISATVLLSMAVLQVIVPDAVAEELDQFRAERRDTPTRATVVRELLAAALERAARERAERADRASLSAINAARAAKLDRLDKRAQRHKLKVSKLADPAPDPAAPES